MFYQLSIEEKFPPPVTYLESLLLISAANPENEMAAVTPH